MAAVANTAAWRWYHWWAAAAAVAAVLLRRRRVVKMQESSTGTAGRLTGGQRRLEKEQLQTDVYVSA